WADDPDSQTVDAQRAHQFQRNHELIEKLVDGGLQLAAEEDPIRRAEHCNGLVAFLANEVQQAAVNTESTRIVEMGDHLDALLKHGVAGNLSKGRVQTPIGSARERELNRVRERLMTLIQPLEDQLQLAADADHANIARLLKALREGRAAVEDALRNPWSTGGMGVAGGPRWCPPWE